MKSVQQRSPMTTMKIDLGNDTSINQTNLMANIKNSTDILNKNYG